MRWQGGRRGGVEDRRGGGGGMGPVAGGGGLVLVVVALIGYFVFGIDPQTIMSAGSQSAPTSDVQASTGTPGDEEGQFADVIHTSANDTWQALFQSEGKDFRPSTIVLYTQGTPTGCGMGEAAMGPFYCPADEKVDIDLEFTRPFRSRNALKMLPDLDEHFGRTSLGPNEAGWKALPGWMNTGAVKR